MSRARQTFRQRDITKALKGAFASGAESVRVEIDRDGKIAVIASRTGGGVTASNDSPANPWDAELVNS